MNETEVTHNSHRVSNQVLENAPFPLPRCD
jgi:hypothetical protein